MRKNSSISCRSRMRKPAQTPSTDRARSENCLTALHTTPAEHYVGLRALRRQDLRRAQAAFAAAVVRNPECVEAHSRLAMLSLFDAEATTESRAAVHASWVDRFEEPRQCMKRS